MATSSFQSSSSEQQSTSVPGIYPTPQSDFSLQLANLLQELGQQNYQWAMGEYARAGRITDAQINNYVQLAQQGADLAGGMIGRYRDTYAPLEDQYARDAQTYDSDARRMHNMGAAEARAQQAQNAAKINAENELESFGIDPSSGRYQDLVLASNTKAAADAAAAGEAARLATEQEGSRRKENAIKIGQQLPGASVNALQSAYSGVSGAVNSALGLANTGANLSATASRYLDPALHPMGPLQGQTQQSTGASRGTGGSFGATTEGSGSGGRRGDTSPTGRGSPADNFQSGRTNPGPGNSAPSNSPAGASSGFLQPGGARAIDLRNNQDVNPPPGPPEPPDWRPPLQPGLEAMGGLPGTVVDPWNNATDPFTWGAQGGSGITPGGWGGDLTTPTAPDWWGGGTDQSAGQPAGGFQDPPSWYDETQGGTADVWGGGGADDYGSYGGWDQYSAPPPDSSADLNSYGGWDSYTPSWSDSAPSYGDWTGGGGDWGDFAKGGPVRPGQRQLPRGNPRPGGQLPRGNPRPGGGYVPPQMSPSGGQRTDDIQAVIPQSGGRAQINAGEFVLPRDVVQWKGQEFFQNMIKKARARRTGGSNG